MRTQIGHKAIEIFIWLILLIGSRWVAYSPYLFSWDAIQFALSFEHYDIGMHRPHPPGYLFYSFAGRLLNLIFNDANLSLVIVNNIFSAGAIFFIIRLVSVLLADEKPVLRWIASRGAALIYLTNPVSWFYGSVAEIYSTEAFFVACLLYLFVQSLKNDKYLFAVSFVLGVAGGFRPSTEVLLLPVYFYLLLGKNKRVIAGSLALFIISNFTWFVPASILSGGVKEYLEICKSQFVRASTNKGFGEVQQGDVVVRLIVKVFQAVSIPILLAIIFRIRRIRIRFEDRVLIASAVFPAIFFLVIHFPKDGYFLIILPNLIAFCCVLLARVYGSKHLLGLIVLATCFLNVRIFLYPKIFIPGRPEKLSVSQQWSVHYFSPNRLMIDYHRERLEAFMNRIEQFNAKKILFVFEESHTFPNRRTTEYYYPQHQSLEIFPNKKRARLIENKWSVQIREPLELDPQIDLIILITGERPEFMQESFEIFDRRFLFIHARELPRRFQIAGFEMRKVRSS